MHIVYTRPDGGVNICHPAEECVLAMSRGGYWSEHPRGFLDIQIERQIEAGHHPDAARRFARALHYGGCTTAEALEIIRDRDCSHLGTGHELWDNLPQDRWFRNAWRHSHNGGPISISMKAARRIHYRKLTETAERVKASLNLGAWKDRIRKAETPEKLRLIWPKGLSPGK